MVGRIVAMHGGIIRVATEGGILLSSARRNLRWEGDRPEAARLVVGDLVHLDFPRTRDGVIDTVLPRRNALLRQAPGGRRKVQILAANVDQALLVFAARQPRPKQGLLDRFLVGCFLGEIEPVIVLNKVDQGVEEVETWLPQYGTLGYALYVVSARTRRGIGNLKRLLNEKTTLFCGPSGAGKSSLLNAVAPGFKLRTGELSESSGKGTHTTSRAELLTLPDGGFVIDTPGLREFGLWQLDSIRLQHAFPEIDALAPGCRFPNCSHSHEPNCAVRESLEEGLIDSGRYQSYLSLLRAIEEENSQRHC